MEWFCNTQGKSRQFAAFATIVVLIAFLVASLPTPSHATDFTARHIGDFGNVNVMQVAGNYDANLPDGSTNDDPRQVITREFYKTHKDEYDFLIIFTDFDFKMPESEAVAFYLQVKNDVQGIGLEQFDNAPFFGSSGKLQGTIDMGNLANNVADPLDPRFEQTLGTLNHEVLHRWGAYLKLPDSSGTGSNALSGKDGDHWSYLLDTKGSLHYGSRWQDNGNGTFTSVETRTYFSPLDLYLMGMLDPSEVPSMLLIENSNLDPTQIPVVGTTISGTPRTVTIAEIIAANGERIPAAAKAQKSFKTAFLYVTSAGALSQTDLRKLEAIRNGFLTRFSVLTDGQALVQVAPIPKEELPSNPVLPSLVKEARDLPPSIDEGMLWLQGRQSEDGHWSDAAQTMVRDTAEAMAALSLFNGAATEVERAAGWLSLNVAVNTDFLARKVESLAKAGKDVSALVTELISLQNADGGWGSGRYFLSNATDTALTLRALAAAGYASRNVLDKAMAYLAGIQNTDGGWSETGSDSLIQPTANALLAFSAYRDLYPFAAAVGRGSVFLQGKQNVGGGFGNSPSTVYDTAATVLALTATGGAKAFAARGVDYLLAEQSADGSWYRSPYQTAMAMQAVHIAMIEPDLAITVANISFIPEKIVKLPTNAVISAEIANLGRTDIPTATVVLYLGEVRPENIIGSQTAAFPAQASTVMTFIVPVVDDTGHLFTVIVDPENLVAEAGEGNNRAAKILQAQPTYDLEVAEAGLQVSSNPAEIFRDITLSTTVRNVGTAAVYSVPVRFYVEAGGEQIDIATRNIDLRAGAAMEVAVVWRASHAGVDLKAIVQIDPANSYAEADETNNQAIRLLTVKGSTLPNLSVSREQILITPNPLGHAKPATISAVVKNNGFAPLAAVPVNFYSGVPEAGGQLVASTIIESLGAGAAVTVTGAWERVASAGQQIVTVVVDPDHHIVEVADDDNEAFVSILALTLPDLVLTASSVSIAPAVPKEGDALNLSITVQNAGEQRVDAVLVQVQKAGALACEGMIPTILGNSQVTLSLECGTATAAGLYSLSVAVDPGNAVEEQHEDNNSITKNLPVQNASLWISEQYISPNGDGVQDQTQFGFRLDATETVTVVVRHADGTVVRTYGGSLLENTSGTQVVWEGLSDSGTVVEDGIYTIEVMNGGGSVLGSAQVVVDNNRSSFVNAFIDGELSHRSGNAPAGSAFVGLLSDGSGALYAKQSWSYYSGSTSCNNDEQSPDGLYLLPSLGLQPELLTPTEWFSNYNICSTIQVGFQSNGEGIAVQQFGYDRISKNMKFVRLWIKKEKSSEWQLMDEKNFSGSAYISIPAKPFWSSDGQSVVYGTLVNNINSIFLLNIETLSKIFIDTDIQSYYGIKWNIDNNLFAYFKNNEIFVADVNGSKFNTNYQSNYYYGFSFEWFQNDKLIIYNEYRDPILTYGRKISIFDFSNIFLSSQVPSPPLVFQVVAGFLSPDRSKAVLLGLDQLYTLDVRNEVMAVKSEMYNGIIDKKEIDKFRNIIANKREHLELSTHPGFWSGENSFMYLLLPSGLYTPYLPDHPLYDPYFPYLVSIDFDIDNTTISKSSELNYSYAQSFYLENGDYSLFSHYEGMTLINLSNGESWTADFEDFPGLQTSIVNEESQSVVAAGNNSLSIIESLQNLSGELLALNRQADILLLGTATDLNFADYRLEYASLQNPGTWNLVRPPADAPVHNDIFTAWIPPQRGTYYVRLTVRDKAGNVKRTVQQIVWAPASPPSVVNLYLDPELFSPNGDGVRDYTEIHYMTLQPVHLEFTVTDNSGNKVRQMVRDHALAGEYTLAWDGRTDSGITVADGTYRVQVLDNKFTVEVDKTPPLVKLGLSAINIDQNVRVTTDLSGYAVDERLKNWRVEFGAGANPLEWKTLAEGSATLAGRDKITGALLLNPPDESLLQKFIDAQVGEQGSRRYRMIATDRAGNSTSTVVGPVEEAFILYEWDMLQTLDIVTGELLRAGSHQVSAIETFDFDLHNLAVQFFINSQWVDAPASINYDAGKVTAQPIISAETGTVDAIRLKGSDAAGNDYYSNALRTIEAFSLQTSCGSYSIEGKNGLVEELATLRYEYLDTSTWIEYEVQDRMIPAGAFFAPVPQLSLPSGKKINIRMTGVGVSGKTYQSSTVSLPTDPCPSPGSGGGDEDGSSPQVTLKVFYPSAECNSLSGKAAITAFMSLPGTSPQSIDLFVDEGEGKRKIGQLTPKLGSRFELPTLSMPEGNHPLTAIYNYLDAAGEEQSLTREDRILVDRELPAAQITYPAHNSFICSTMYTQPDMVWYGIPVSAMASDNLGSARYELFYGEGDNPVEWHTAITFKGGKWEAISGTLQGQGGIGIWNTGVLQGRYSLKLRVIDAAGNVVCHIIKVDINSGVDFSKYAVVLPSTIDPSKARAIPLFSPTAPDTSHEIKVEYRLDRPATINAMVFPVQRANDGVLTLAETPVRTMDTNKTYLAGSEFVVWNGRNDAGNVVDDGLYGIVVRATNSCGEGKERWVTVELDGTAPQTTISFPGVGDKPGTVVEVRGTATDKYFTDYRLEVGQGQDPVAWTLLATGAASVVEGVLGSWNDYQQEGLWTLRLSADDEVKNRNQIMVTVDLGDREDLIKSLLAEPRLISPDQNGIDDYTIVKYVLTAASEVLLEILDTQGQIVKSFTTTSADAGLFNFVWDGVNQQGNFSGDGEYLVRLTAIKADDAFIKQIEFLTIGVDTSGPAISLTDPGKNYLNQDYLSIVGSISDQHLVKYIVKLVGPGGTTGIDQGVQARSSFPFGTINELAEGAYTLVVEAEDKLGNSNTLEKPVILDRTLPKVTLQTSGNERFFGNNRQEIALTGGVVEENPDKYVLRYGPGSDPANWHVLFEGEGLPASDGIFNWDVGANTGLTDGVYTLALQARDKAGLENETRVVVVVDNSLPTAAFAMEEGSFISQGSAITGTVFDDNMTRWNLDLARGACNAGLYEWVALKSGSAAVVDAPLLTWIKLAQDGDYCLRLTVEDMVDHRTETIIPLRQDSIPPQVPLLAGEIEEKTGIHLQWPANNEPDLAGYQLYRNGQKLNVTPLEELEYLDLNLAEGTFTYSLIAVDLAGNQSAPSSPFTATIDLTGPSARLIAPTPNAYVSGFVAIQGTVYSRTDFKEYRVSVGAGPNPTDWALLRTSPLPAVAAVNLADWDTLGITEGIYTIKLEAEDLSGNVTSRSSLVTLDNTPPQTPLLLSAVASGADVTINWDPNNEQDLAGYLLFRNDRLVNAGDKVLADFRQHLLTGEIYLDSGVPDGVQSYYLLAMDKAGNLSAASNIREVTLDTHAPQATLVSPKNNATFEGPMVMRAECADSDLAKLTYQYRSQQGLWIDFGGGSELSVTAPFDPQVAELTFGTYIFRVVATDLAGKVDPNPSSISLVYTDQTPPATPSGFKAVVNGNEVKLTWNANTDIDLAGYTVYRIEGSNRVKLNQVLLTQTEYRDALLPDGQYGYEVTAVDKPLGNESAPSAVSARIYAPIFVNLPEVVGRVSIQITGEGVTPLAIVAISQFHGSGITDHYSAVADGIGRFSVEVSLSPGENRLRATATDEAGNVSRGSGPGVTIYDLPPQTPRSLTAGVQEAQVHLTWEPALNSDPDLAGYRIFRTEGEKAWQAVQQGLVTGTSYLDENLANAIYRYRVVAVDLSGNESIPSPEATAEIDIAPPLAPEITLVTSSAEGGTLVLTWAPKDDAAESFRVYRALSGNGPYLQIFTLPAETTTYTDQGLTDGWAYYYVVTSVDALGNESAYSNQRFGIPADSTPPLAPVIIYPAMAGRSVAVESKKIALSGMAEPGASVEIYRDGLWVGKTGAAKETEVTSEGIDYLGNYAALSPNGKQLALIDVNGTLRVDTLGDGTAISVANKVEGVVWSPGGDKLLYRYTSDPMPPFGLSAQKLAIYEIKTGVNQNLTSDLSANETSPSWSKEGGEIAFISDSSGTPSIWLKETDSGALSQIQGNYYPSSPQLSPDGERVAYFQNGSTLIITNLAGETQVIDNETNGVSLAWSPKGDRLAFISHRDGAEDLFYLDLESGGQVRVTDDPEIESLIAWSPDGTSLVFSTTDSESSKIWSVANAEKKLLTNHPGSLIELGWRDSGEITMTDGVRLSFANPAGLFKLDNVSLEPGENLFFAIAEDQSANRSPAAEAISVIAKTVPLPDVKITAEDLFVYPPFPHPGEEATVILTVANPSEMVIDNVPVEVYLWDAGGKLSLLQSVFIAKLNPSTSETLSFSFIVGSEVGTNTVIAVVDPEDRIEELIESNNNVSKDFFVGSSQGNVEIKTRLNGSQFTGNQDVQVENGLINNGELRTIILGVSIEDAEGIALEAFTPVSVSLPYGSPKTLNYRWNTGVTFAGEYRVHTTAKNSSGDLLAEEVEIFQILPDVKVDIIISTDKAVYGAHETVRAGIQLKNAGVNNILSNLMVKTGIFNGQNSEVYRSEKIVSSLWPGMQNNLAEEWNTGLVPPGAYRVQTEAYVGGARIESAVAPFAIAAEALLNGEVTLPTNVILAGTEFIVGYHIENSGNTGISGILQASIVDAKTLEVRASDEKNLSLTQGTAQSGDFTFSSQGLLLQSYLVILKFTGDSVPKTIGSASLIIRDGTAPVMTVLSPQAGESYGAGIPLMVRVADEASGVARVEYQINADEWLPLPLTEPSNGRYSLVWEPALQMGGTYNVRFRAFDQAGNSTESGPVEFEVQMDNTPPSTEITFNNESYIAGATHFVAPETTVSFSAVDDLSGVQTTSYRFDDEPAWQIYSGPLPLADLAYGTHILHYRSVDFAGNAEEEQRITLSLLGVEVATELLNRPRVLVWTEDPELGGKAQPPYSLATTRALLGEAFGDPEIYTTVITDKEEFRDLLRSGIYNVVMVIRQDIPLDTLFLREMREAVNRGTGLLVSHWSNSVPPLLQDLFGVDFKGALSMAATERTLHLYAGPLGDEQTLNVSGRVLKTTLTDGFLAGIVPAESVCEGVRSLTLYAAVSAQSGDQITATISKSEGKKLVPVDEEQFVVDALPTATINRFTGNGSGDLAFVAVADDGITLSLSAPYGYLEGSYHLALNIARPDGSSISTGPVNLTPSCSAYLQAGIEFGLFRVVEVDEVRVKTGADLPALILGRYGTGRTAFLTYDLMASALNGQRSAHLALLGKAASYFLPAAVRPEAGGLSLLETRIRQHGSGFALLAVDALGAGLTHVPLFDLRQSSLSYTFHLEDGETAAWRYFVRFADRQGDFAKTTAISLGLESGEIPYAAYPASFNVEADAHTRLVQALAWVDEQIPLYPEKAAALQTIREELIRIYSLPRTTSAERDLVIHAVVQIIHQILQIGIDVAGVRQGLDVYLGIVAAEAGFIP